MNSAAPFQLMGIVNVTPDSFSDGGQFDDTRAAIRHGLTLVEEGADILDIGGESTRPGAEPVSEMQEIDRIMPVIESLASQTDVILSVDTRKPRVAEVAIAAGATIWNDVSGLTYSEDSVTTAAMLNCKIVLMHTQGDPGNMQDDPQYQDVVTEVLAWLAGRIEVCAAAGIDKTRLIADPGIGFGKTLGHNLSLLGALDQFRALDVPLLLGASRKKFISLLDRDGPASERLGGSIAAVLVGYARGTAIFRVHDVAATRQALNIARAITASHRKG